MSYLIKSFQVCKYDHVTLCEDGIQFIFCVCSASTRRNDTQLCPGNCFQHRQSCVLGQDVSVRSKYVRKQEQYNDFVNYCQSVSAEQRLLESVRPLCHRVPQRT